MITIGYILSIQQTQALSIVPPFPPGTKLTQKQMCEAVFLSPIPCQNLPKHPANISGSPGKVIIKDGNETLIIRVI